MATIGDLFYVDATGLKYPDYPTVLEALKNEFRRIYGPDVYLEPDSQDGQWVAVLALSMYETMLTAAAVYNSFSPHTAMGDALSRNVKINGIARRTASYSQADVVIVGQAGTVITNGMVEDVQGRKWQLPPTVTIPLSGEITVTARAVDLGAITAGPNTINKIATPTLGWQSVTNPAAAVPGDPVESDAELRRRQALSAMIPSLSVLEGLIGAVASLPGVQRYRGYENDTGETDANGLPPHSIALVVQGGDAEAIARTIATKKTAGTRTYGTTAVDIIDAYGITNTIRFFRPTMVTIEVEVSILARPGYLSTTADKIKQAVAEYINGLTIGDDIYISKLYVPANLGNSAEGGTFDVVQVRVRRAGGSYGTSNITLAFNELAQCDPANVTVIAQ